MTDYEAMTMADLVAFILAEGIPGDPAQAEFARRVRPQDWPDGDPVQAILTRIKKQEPAGDTARLLAVAEIADSEHAPYVTRGEARCCTCPDGSGEDAAEWPCDPYLRILLALDGAPRPVRGELVRREVRGELPPGVAVGQATSILQQQAASANWREREDSRRALGQLGRAMTPCDYDDDGRPQVTGVSMPGALATLDAMLCSSQGGFAPATVVSYRDRGARVLAEIQRCVWAPAWRPPTRYALAWSQENSGDGTGTRQEEIVPAWEVELPPGTAAPWLASPPPGTPEPEAGEFLLGDDPA